MSHSSCDNNNRNTSRDIDNALNNGNKLEGEMETEHECPKKFMKVTSKSGTEDVHYSIYSAELPEEIIQNILSDLNETEETKKQGIRDLRGFLKENELTCADDDILVAVLRNCKYDMQKSESKLQRFLKIRRMIGSKLGKMDFKTIESLFDKNAFGILPYRDKFGRIILYTRSFPQVDQYETDFIAVCAISLLLYVLTLPKTSAIGVSYIDECKYSSVYEYYTTLKYFRHLLMPLFDIPLRISKVDLVNEHFSCRLFYKAVRPLLPQKLNERVSFLGSGYKNLHKIYHPNLLPEEFDGTLGPMNDKVYRKKFLHFMKKLREEYELSSDTD